MDQDMVTILSAGSVEELTAAWGSLSAAEAEATARGVRFVLPGVIPDWRDRAGENGDVCVRRREFVPGLVAFDGDGTLLDGETIDHLGAAAGVADRVAEITRQAMEGELDFEGSLRERVALLAGRPESDLSQVRSEMELHRGVADALRGLTDRGVARMVFSGGFRFLLDPLARELGLDAVVANQLEVVGGSLTGQVVGAVVDAGAKADALRREASSRAVSLERTVAVGDGANDLPMMRAAGIAIGFCPKPVVRAEVDGVIGSGDMRALLDFLAPA